MNAEAAARARAGGGCGHHLHEVSACPRLDGGSVLQRARAVALTPFRRRSAATPTAVCKSRSSCSDVLLLLVLLAVAVWSTSCRWTFAGCDSFMELCGCATPQLGLCGTASKLTVMDPSLAQLASWCL